MGRIDRYDLIQAWGLKRRCRKFHKRDDRIWSGFLFKIAKTDIQENWTSSFEVPAECDQQTMARFCHAESWSADFSTGLFDIGPFARQQHGLAPEGMCGLLSLVRNYPNEDRCRVLSLFEKAALTPSSFCFSTKIVRSGRESWPMMCLGESTHDVKPGTGSISGLFIFPRIGPKHLACSTVQ
ncbi:hypothetical protein [Pseudohoeflea coraliihabitans]|uniref:PAS domain-containing protein n=1 Tax=Pseudohoeflea coraliihabitans TaxID=2860393 RepID=A0ABS6WMC6_9HYPH|nr:hypothetical protein [Pseudohoeflea sp. DP4N28-3]MBW3097106.1 hypothetical protein [Pseudohoeflea sp. DP4N28-3]